MDRILSSLGDDELVAMLRGGKQEAEKAFTELYRRYSAMVHAYCSCILNDKQQAEDIFQDTFINFYQALNKDFNSVNISGFLIRIARNLCLNYKRDHVKTVPIESVEYLLDFTPGYDKEELLQLIMMAMNLLEFEYKEIFVLREFDGLPYSEIAKILNISEENARKRCFRSRQKVKEILAPYLKDLCK